MAKFNTRSIGTRTVNKAGGKAYLENPQLEFVSTILTTFLTDQYYRSADETMDRITQLIDVIPDKKFMAKGAIFARTKYGMRSVSHLIAGELAHRVKGADWTKRFYEKVVYRPDDISEILSYYLTRYKKPIPNSLKKGLAKAFDKFDGYSLAKYKGAGKEVNLIDVINLVRPKPTERNKAALEQLIKEKLVSKDTWETKLTQAGQKAKAEAKTDEEKDEIAANLKKEGWIDLIKNKKIKYFALLRNLRNIIEQAPEALDEALVMLVDERQIKTSLVLPFRFLTAIKEIEEIGGKEARKVLVALNKALDISMSNVPVFDGDTVVVLDVSGSMNGRPQDIGSVFSAILVKSNNADMVVFADSAKYMAVNIADSTLSISKALCSVDGGGTNFPSIFRKLNRKYDRVIILSDMQGWMEGGAPSFGFEEYKKKYTANPYVYSFNLQDYGTLMFPENKVFCLAGWSEKVFDLMKLLETDRAAMIAEIEKVEL